MATDWAGAETEAFDPLRCALCTMVGGGERERERERDRDRGGERDADRLAAGAFARVAAVDARIIALGAGLGERERWLLLLLDCSGSCEYPPAMMLRARFLAAANIWRRTCQRARVREKTALQCQQQISSCAKRDRVVIW